MHLFCGTKVIKAKGEAMMSCKAYNARVVSEYLAHCLQLAWNQTDDQLPPDRLFGKWRRAHDRDDVDDLLPFEAAAMKHGLQKNIAHAYLYE